MFIAKFEQTQGLPFKADKNGNYPFIGTVLAGKAKGTIINGTMFQRQDLEPNKLYACENSIDPEYPENVQTNIVSSVSIIEFVALKKELGAPVNLVTATEEAVEAEAEVV